MPMRLTGMYSGLDTDSVIKELVKAKSTKVDKAKKSKTKTEWKQEAWTDLNKKIKNLFSGTLSNLRFSTTYKKKTTSVSNSSAVSVITGDSAMNGVQSLSVTGLAKSGYLTGAVLKTQDGTKAKEDTKISDLKHGTLSLGEGDAVGGSFTVTVNGKATNIDITADTTIKDVVGKLNEAGVSANFDEKNQRIFIASAQSGKDYDFAITANEAGGFAALSFLGINTSLSDVENAKTKKEYQSLVTLANDLKENKIVYNNGNEADGIDYEATMANIDVDSDLYKAIKANMPSGVDDAYATGIDVLLQRANYAEEVLSYGAASFNSGSRIAAENATIVLNGETYESNNNNIEVNGLTFTCLSKANDITVTTQEDTDGIYDLIRDFIKQYNEIINQMDKLYNADAAKGYEPLTDEEKEEMSDKEVEKWEQKIKDSILRKDSTLGTLSSAMKEAMLGGFEVNGNKMFLSDFGIETLGYFLAPENEKNAFHIAGDDKDNETSGKADKLKSMIATDSDTVVSFFTQLAREVYGKMDKLSASSDYTTKGSFFEDKKYKADITDYESKIKELEAKLADYEDKYYAKFSKMEVALSKLQNSTNSLLSMFGGGQ
ncbi:flagellar hook-associated protein 2 [Lachnospiraceae bacterium YSD2013]|nr:flagellar hook-associated protein 2 [Lachnospiraceae bacterium YSD2013]